MNKMKININEHLTFDELYMLAESAEDPFGFDDNEIELLQHLKTCEECYKKFRILLAVNDVIPFYEDRVESIYNQWMEEEFTSSESLEFKDDFLAIWKFIRNKSDQISATLRQIGDGIKELQFYPAPVPAVRRKDADSESSYLTWNSQDDPDNTFIMYDMSSNELIVQINTDTDRLRSETIGILLEYDDQSYVEIPTRRIGSLLQGNWILDRDDDFQICFQTQTNAA